MGRSGRSDLPEDGEVQTLLSGWVDLGGEQDVKLSGEEQPTKSKVVCLGAADCKEGGSREVSLQEEIRQEDEKEDKTLGGKHGKDEAPSGVGEVDGGEGEEDESGQRELCSENSQAVHLSPKSFHKLNCRKTTS